MTALINPCTVTPRWSADFCNSLKTDSRRVSMNFLPFAIDPLGGGVLTTSCEIRLGVVGARWGCNIRIQISDIPGITGQYVERPGNLTVAEAGAIIPSNDSQSQPTLTLKSRPVSDRPVRIHAGVSSETVKARSLRDA